MVVLEPEILSQGEVEIESSLLQDQQMKNHAFSSLGRQSSIYSLTLDEFQHTLCDGGKNFGSMNMDEFLNSIWTAEENQAINHNNNNSIASNNNNNNNSSSINPNNDVNLSLGEAASSEKMIAKQPSLPRQGSLTLPPPLCRKTVDEVWSEIHKSRQQGRQRNSASAQSSGSIPGQPTFGEMTLEDFLVKAGVVREQSTDPVPPPHPPPPQQQYGMYQNSSHPSMGGPTFVSRAPMMGMTAAGGRGASSVAATYPTLSHGGGGVGDSSVAYGKRNGGYHAPPVCYHGRMGNGGEYGPAQAMGVETSASPVSPDGIGTGQVDSGPNQYGIDVGGSRGRKRNLDGPVEKVVERRQRRMIKNRESAARSRARKQAYTVELEAELNQLREENAHLKETLAELERKRKQQYFEEVKMRAQTRAQKAKERLRVMRRTLSCPL